MGKKHRIIGSGARHTKSSKVAFSSLGRDFTGKNHMDEFQNLLENTGDIAIYRLVPEIASLRNSASLLPGKLNRFYFWGAIEAIVGYSRNDFLSGIVRWEDIVHTSDYLHLIRSREALFSAGKNRCEVEYRIRHRGGGMRWVREMACLVHDVNGCRVHLQGLIRDITAEKTGRPCKKELPKATKAVPRANRKSSGRFLSLSPKELSVVEGIKRGESSKDIAKSLKLSVRTVESYRDKIRMKMGLKNKKINLKTYLLSRRGKKALGKQDAISKYP